jgi:hypothetical protein
MSTAADYGLLGEAVRDLIRARRFNDAQAILYEAAQFTGGIEHQQVLAQAMADTLPKSPER